MRDGVSGGSKGYGFISFDNFKSSDQAILMLNKKYLSNKLITVEYAHKPGTKNERFGSNAERLLEANRPPSLQTGMIYGNNYSDYNQAHQLIIPQKLKELNK